MIAGYIIAIFVLLALSGFFSGSETALAAASRARMHALEKEGDKRAAAENRLISNREGLIGSILLGNNVVNILASVLATSLFTELFGQGGMAMAMATGVMTILVLVFAEVMPKTYAIGRPDAMAMSVAGIISVLVALASWIVTAIQAIVSVTLKLVGLGTPAEAITADEEIRGAIDLHLSEGGVGDADRQRLVGALDLKELTVEDVMIHRKNIKMLSADLDPRQMVMKALASPHTRIPLYRGEKEEIVGILHAKDLLRAIIPLGGNLASLDLDSIMRKPWFVPETTPVQDQLDAFLKERSHFALVIDEYGELQGLITLEDILEEIVGEMSSNTKESDQDIFPQEDGSYYIDGSAYIRDVNKALDWVLPTDGPKTMNGLITETLESIPDANVCLQLEHYRIETLQVSDNVIKTARIIALPRDAEDDE